MRDLCLKKCKEVNFLSIIEHGSSDEDPSNQTVSSVIVGRKLRYCAIYSRGGNSLIDSSLNNHPCIRSLLVFPCGDGKARKPFLGNTRKLLSLVRVLDLEGIDNLGGFPMECACFIHLRYLSVKGAQINYSLSGIWDCKYVETFDLRVPNILKVSNKFWKLDRLRHLYLPSLMELKGSKKLVLKPNQLQQMETLKNFNVHMCDIKDLEKMRNLRVFSGGGFGSFLNREDLEVLLKSPMITTKRLVSPLRLNISAKVLNEDPTILTTKVSDISIDGINVSGRIEEALFFPHSLTRVHLSWCELGEEGFGALEKLPRLEKLELSSDAVKVSKMRFSNAGFTQLVRLILSTLHTLEELEVEEGALPNLQYLKISHCEMLKMIPEGLPSSVQIK